MVRAKQKEREAKRLEGDIKKEQRQLHYSIRDLDVGKYQIDNIFINFSLNCVNIIIDASRKRYYAEKNLSKNLQEKDRIEREFIKKREKVNFYQLTLV